MIIIPVAPSAIDIHATAAFIQELMLTLKTRASGIPICAIANRVRQGSPIYKPLEKFLESLDIPFLTALSDSESYIEASAQALGSMKWKPHWSRTSELSGLLSLSGLEKTSLAYPLKMNACHYAPLQIKK